MSRKKRSEARQIAWYIFRRAPLYIGAYLFTYGIAGNSANAFIALVGVTLLIEWAIDELQGKIKK